MNGSQQQNIFFFPCFLGQTMGQLPSVLSLIWSRSFSLECQRARSLSTAMLVLVSFSFCGCNHVSGVWCMCNHYIYTTHHLHDYIHYIVMFLDFVGTLNTQVVLLLNNHDCSVFNLAIKRRKKNALISVVGHK